MAKNKDCIFCMIVRGELPSYVIYDDGEHIAFLDLYPNIMGQALVIPKKHIESDVFAADDNDISAVMIAAKKVAAILQKKLGAGRVHVVFEGTGVNHLHAKLYPAIGTNEGFSKIIAAETAYFQSYPGYVTTLLGPKAKDEDLKRVHKKITGK